MREYKSLQGRNKRPMKHIYGVETYKNKTVERVLELDGQTVLIKAYNYYSDEPKQYQKPVRDSQTYLRSLLKYDYSVI